MGTKSMKKLPAAILFDWDNTLVDTWPVIYEAMRKTFLHMGKEPWSLEQTKERVHRSMRDAFPEIFGVAWEEAGHLYQQHFREIHLQRLNALPQAEALLNSLFSLDSRPFLGVVSNKTNVNLHKEVAKLEWAGFFDVVIGAQDAARDKPAADPVLLALKDSGIAPSSEVWLVGDSVTDLECAKNAGISAILYGDEGAQTQAILQNFQVLHHVLNHKNLADFLGISLT